MQDLDCYLSIDEYSPCGLWAYLNLSFRMGWSCCGGADCLDIPIVSVGCQLGTQYWRMWELSTFLWLQFPSRSEFRTFLLNVHVNFWLSCQLGEMISFLPSRSACTFYFAVLSCRSEGIWSTPDTGVGCAIFHGWIYRCQIKLLQKATNSHRRIELSGLRRNEKPHPLPQDFVYRKTWPPHQIQLCRNNPKPLWASVIFHSKASAKYFISLTFQYRLQSHGVARFG